MGEERNGGERIKMYSAIKTTEKIKWKCQNGQAQMVGWDSGGGVWFESDAEKRGNLGLSDNSGSVSQPVVLLCLGRCGKISVLLR